MIITLLTYRTMYGQDLDYFSYLNIVKLERSDSPFFSLHPRLLGHDFGLLLKRFYDFMYTFMYILTGVNNFL